MREGWCSTDYFGERTRFWARSIGDFGLCIKGQADALINKIVLPFSPEVRWMRGGHSEVKKVDPGPSFCGPELEVEVVPPLPGSDQGNYLKC